MTQLHYWFATKEVDLSWLVNDDVTWLCDVFLHKFHLSSSSSSCAIMCFDISVHGPCIIFLHVLMRCMLWVLLFEQADQPEGGAESHPPAVRVVAVACAVVGWNRAQVTEKHSTTKLLSW